MMENEEVDDTLLFELVRDKSFQGEIEGSAKSLTLANPVCGDEVTFFILLSESGEIEKIRFKTKGCFICKATAAAISKYSDKKQQDQVLIEIRKFRAEFVVGGENSSKTPEFQLLHQLRKYPTRTKCVLLPFETLASLLEESKK